MLLADKELKELIGKGLLVQDMVDPNVQIQQCGVDLTVSKVFELEGEGVLDFSNEQRKLPKYKEVPISGDFWMLDKGVYHIGFNERIVLPKNIAGFLMPRSSALVCGIVQHTAVWDPGYEGRSFFHAEVARPVKIYKNARLGQMVFIRVSKETEGYKGIFHDEDVTKHGRRGTE